MKIVNFLPAFVNKFNECYQIEESIAQSKNKLLIHNSNNNNNNNNNNN